jgi:hypothetical protein
MVQLDAAVRSSPSLNEYSNLKVLDIGRNRIVTQSLHQTETLAWRTKIKKLE